MSKKMGFPVEFFDISQKNDFDANCIKSISDCNLPKFQTVFDVNKLWGKWVFHSIELNFGRERLDDISWRWLLVNANGIAAYTIRLLRQVIGFHWERNYWSLLTIYRFIFFIFKKPELRFLTSFWQKKLWKFTHAMLTVEKIIKCAKIISQNCPTSYWTGKNQ